MFKLNDKVTLSEEGVKAFDAPNETNIRNSAYGIITYYSESNIDVTWYDYNHNKIKVTGSYKGWIQHYIIYDINEIEQNLDKLIEKYV